jgi:hypothetical protein
VEKLGGEKVVIMTKEEKLAKKMMKKIYHNRSSPKEN